MTRESNAPAVPATDVAPPTPNATAAGSATTSSNKRWKRADKIAFSAILVAVASLVVAILVYVDTRRTNESTNRTSQSALKIAQQADVRSQITDQLAFQALVMLIDERVNQIIDSTADAKWQLEGAARGTSGALLIQLNSRGLAFVDQLAQRIPALDLSVDQITSLAKGPPGIAASVTQCVRMRDQLVTDLQGYKGATIQGRAVKGLDQNQLMAFPVLPDRIGHVNEVCRAAAEQLTALIPDQFKSGVTRGTLGELMDAQAEASEELLEYKKAVKRSAHLTETGHR